jgi:ATP-binding cassette, subfamily B, bacterial
MSGSPAVTPSASADTNTPLVPWILSFLRPHRGRVTQLAVLMLAEILLGVLQPWPFAWVIDHVLGGKPFSNPQVQSFVTSMTHGSKGTLLIAVVVTGVVLQIVNQLVSAYGTQVQVDTGQRMVYDLRYKLFNHLQALGLYHHITTSTSDAVYRVDIDAYSIENLVMSGIFPLANSITTLAVMFSILAYWSLTIALLSLTVVPFLYLCLRYYTMTLVNREERVKELESKLLERLYETFSAMRLVKSFAREPHEADRYARAGKKTMEARISITWQQSLFSVIVSTITILGTGLILVVGGSQVMRGQLSIGILVVVVNYLGAVYGPLSAIAHTTGQLQGAIAGAKRVRAMFALTPETVDSPNAIDATNVVGDIRFEGVGFDYPDGTKVLHDIDFTAKPGEMVALVGLTGAGKTTLVSLIPRFYNTTAGRVLIDGVDVRNYRIRSLREKIAIVLQDPVLFQGTIADNLRYGRLEASAEEIDLASRKGLRRGDRRSRRQPVRRRAPAPERGAGHHQERADPDSRRAHVLTGRDFGRDRVRRAATAPRRPHDARHRAPPLDRSRRRLHSRAGWRPDRRKGPARGSSREQPALPPHVRTALGRQVARRSGERRRAHRGRATITP